MSKSYRVKVPWITGKDSVKNAVGDIVTFKGDVVPAALAANVEPAGRQRPEAADGDAGEAAVAAIRDARSEAAAIVQKANDEAVRIVQDAQQVAEKLSQEALTESVNLVEQAKTEAAAVKEKAAKK